MSDENKFKHHEYLQTVADEDVRFVLDKDRSYGASWKKRGGVGAFMMLARKWDRLETMLSETPVTSGRGVTFTKYDIFSLMALQEDPTHPRAQGQDGSVLAEVRDLRRYLLNVEAEMMARGVVLPPPHASDEDTVGLLARASGCSRDEALHKLLQTAREQALLQTPRGPAATPGTVLTEEEKEDLRRVFTIDADEKEEQGIGDVDILKGLMNKPGVLRPEQSPAQRCVPRMPPEDDDSRHASLVPWAVSMRWRFKHDMQPGGPRAAEFDKWWRVVSPGTWALEPCVSSELVPPELYGLYGAGALWRTIQIEDCPPDARGWFPRLRRTLNAIEHGALPAWQGALYELSTARDPSGEYTLRSDYEAWHVDSDDEAAA
jgi:hypothetical protein